MHKFQVLIYTSVPVDGDWRIQRRTEEIVCTGYVDLDSMKGTHAVKKTWQDKNWYWMRDRILRKAVLSVLPVSRCCCFVYTPCSNDIDLEPIEFGNKNELSGEIACNNIAVSQDEIKFKVAL